MTKQERVFYNILFLLLISVFSNQSISLSFAQPSSNNILNSQSDLIKVFISNLIVNKSPSGFILITGLIQNNSTEEVDHIIINVTFYNANDDVAKRISRFASGPFTIYESNSAERFSFIVGNEDYDHYEANAFANVVK